MLCNPVQAPQPDHGKNPRRVCRARNGVCQETAGLRDAGHDKEPHGALAVGRWVPAHGVSALECAWVTLSSSSRQGHGQACPGAAARAGADVGVWGLCPPQHRLGLCLHRAELPPGESCARCILASQPGRSLWFLVLQCTDLQDLGWVRSSPSASSFLSRNHLATFLRLFACVGVFQGHVRDCHTSELCC